MNAKGRDINPPQTRGRFAELDIANTLLVLNVAAVLVYFFVAFRYNYLVNVNALMFSLPDAIKYRDIGDWLTGRLPQVPAAAALYPMLYPLLVGFIRTLTRNPYAIWAVQFVFWLTALNLTAVAVYFVTRRRLLLVIVFCLFMLNVSAIVLSFYALTETTVLFLLSIWILILAKYESPNWSFGHVLVLTFLLSAITIIKPIFELPLAMFVAYVLVRQVAGRIKNVLALAFGLGPVYLQLLFMITLYGTFGLARIGDITLRYYYFAQVYAAGNDVSVENVRSLVADYSNGQILSYILAHPAISIGIYLRNLTDNLTGGPMFTDEYLKPHVFGQITDVVYLIAHLIFILLMACLILNGRQVPVFVGLLYLSAMILFIASGISANEGDRLTVQALPLWLAAYVSGAAFIIDGLIHGRRAAV